MFRSRQAVTTRNMRNVFFSPLGKKCNQNIVHNSQQLQRQQRFGSNPLNLLLAAKEENKQLLLLANQTILSGHNAQIGGSSSKMFLLVEQQKKRFFASSSDHGQQQQIGRRQKPYVESDLDEKVFQLSSTVVLRLQVRRGHNRALFFRLAKSVGRVDIGMNFAPEEAYQLVRAMDTLLNTLMAKHQQEINASEQQLGPVVLESQRISSDRFDFQLELAWLGDAYEFKMTCRINTNVNGQLKKGKELRLPVQALPWLRQTLAQALVEHDAGNSQQLGPAPPELPQSILQENTQRRRLFASSFSSTHGQQQQQQQFVGQNSFKERPVQQNLEERQLPLDSNSAEVLLLKVQRGETRRLYFRIVKKLTNICLTFNFVPEEAHRMVSAMDTLLNTLHSKHQQEMGSSNSSAEQQLGPVVLESQRFNAEYFDFQLELVWLDNANGYQFKVKSIKNVLLPYTHKERELRLPVRALPWLRQNLAQMLAEHDDNAGSSQQQLGPTSPAELPQSTLMKVHTVASVPLQQTTVQQQQYSSKMKKKTDEEKGDMEELKAKTSMNKEAEKAEERDEEEDIFKLLGEAETLAKEVEEEQSRRRRSATTTAAGCDDDEGRGRMKR